MITKKKAGRLTKFGRIIHLENGIIPLLSAYEKKSEKLVHTGSTRHGSGWPRTVSMEENMNLVEELVCSQKERLNTHLAPTKIAKKNRNQSFINAENGEKKKP